MGHNIDGTEVNEKALSKFKEKIKLEDIEFVRVYKPLNEKIRDRISLIEGLQRELHYCDIELMDIVNEYEKNDRRFAFQLLDATLVYILSLVDLIRW